jgi:hypothetical protein
LKTDGDIREIGHSLETAPQVMFFTNEAWQVDGLADSSAPVAQMVDTTTAGISKKKHYNIR